MYNYFNTLNHNLKRGILKFSEKISISPSNFNEKNMPSALSGDILSRILTTYEELNPDWLLLGKGEMLRSDAQKTVSSSADSDKIWKEILAEKDRRIEELIIENYKIREQVAHIQAITPPISQWTDKNGVTHLQF